MARRFAEVAAGTVSEQEIEATFDGDTVGARNVILTLPGESPATVVVLAARDAGRGPGAASSAAATGVLTELAAGLGVAGHEKTYVVASTSGGAEGAAGARRLVEALPDPAGVEAVIVISQPGVAQRAAPFVVTSSTNRERPAIQLARTAREAVSTQAQEAAPAPGVLQQIARLAIPAGLGEQAPLIAMGLDAVAISSAGERPPDPAADGPEDVSGDGLGDFGRAVQSTVQAVDATAVPLERGPDTYLEAGGNLVPGWALSLLALALLLPSAVAAVDTVARASRRSQRPAVGGLWIAAWSLPPIAALVVVYVLALLGVVPGPEFPFDPGSHSIGVAAVFSFVFVAAAAIAAGRVVGALWPPPGLGRGSLIAGLGLVSATATLLAWLANPFLGLLLAPTAHVWLLAAGPPVAARTAATAVGAVAALLPLGLAVAHLVTALELGIDAPWTAMLLLADGQIGVATAVAVSLCVGSTAASIAVASRRPPGARSASAVRVPRPS